MLASVEDIVQPLRSMPRKKKKLKLAEAESFACSTCRPGMRHRQEPCMREVVRSDSTTGCTAAGGPETCA